MFDWRRCGALLLLLAAALPCAAQQGGDLQAQIEYAYQTGDLNQLTDLTQNLKVRVKDDPSDAALHYHLAHAEYRYAAVDGERRAHEADGALADCIDQLKAILDKNAASVEPLALEGGCYLELARRSTLEAGMLRSRADDRLQTAYKLDPRNPRVVYFTATSMLERAKPGSPQYRQALAQMQYAAQLFEQSSETEVDKPSWGHADAYLAYGRLLLAGGDPLGARNWIEKALITAPDFKAAQQQLAALTRH